jgi:hypothetical protein
MSSTWGVSSYFEYVYEQGGVALGEQVAFQEILTRFPPSPLPASMLKSRGDCCTVQM